MKRTIKSTCLMLLSAALLLLMPSCQDDLGIGGRGADGLPATIEVSVCIPQMTQQTRALVDEPGANFCQDLWVGVYSADGQRISTKEDALADVNGTVEVVDENYEVTNLTLEGVSGNCYIVAVANAGYNEGRSEQLNGGATATIKELLDDADTWEKFLSIEAVRDTDNVDQLTYDLLMSGYYCASKDDCAATTVPSIYVAEGTNKLPGAIYLRRNLAYNKFNIQPANDNIHVALKSWRVCNVPGRSWVMEKTTNAPTSYDDDYGCSVKNTEFAIDDENANLRSFDFYLMENKHQAIDGAITDADNADDLYVQRDREYKKADGTNSGVYCSLVGSNTTDLNNRATYVEFVADVDYYISRTDAENNPETAVVQDYNGHDADAVHRFGEVTYIVHLGYCEGKNGTAVTKATAEDFNCRRNTRYTYNVKIAGLNRLVVEATSTEEPQPGAEGEVSDIYGGVYDLDSHYCVFNIALSDAERAQLKWRITAPFAGTYYQFYSDDVKGDVKKLAETEANELYSWIKFKPTTGQDVLAVYKTSTDDVSQWSINDLLDVSGHPNNNAADADGNKWYTVFVDEYVYHEYPDHTNKESGKESLWYTYVNQGARVAELIRSEVKTSSDKQTSYVRSQYAFSQRAIQSFYADVQTASSEIGVGVEYTNEIFGLNLQLAKNPWWSSGNGGRYNSVKFASQMENVNDSLVDFSVPTTIQAYTRTSSSWGAKQSELMSFTASTQPVPAPAIHWRDRSNGTFPQGYYGTSTFSYYPNPSDYRVYYLQAACLNRNRDENGDGKLTQDEIKWYLPTYALYVQVTVGERGLVSPLIDFNDYPRNLYIKQNSTGGEITGRLNFHFASSNNTVFWAEEGLSESSEPCANGSGYGGAFQVRCVRDLGANPSDDLAQTAVSYSLPYEMNSLGNGGYRVKNLYYDSQCIRPSVKGYLAPNALNSSANRLPQAFEVAKSCIGGNGEVIEDNYGIFKTISASSQYMTAADGIAINGGSIAGKKLATEYMYRSASINSLCRLYSQEADGSDRGTWRMPNIKELAILYCHINGQLSGVMSCSHDYWTSYADQNGKYRFYGRGSSSTYINRGYCDLVSTDNWKFRVRCVRDIDPY